MKLIGLVFIVFGILAFFITTPIAAVLTGAALLLYAEFG